MLGVQPHGMSGTTGVFPALRTCWIMAAMFALYVAGDAFWFASFVPSAMLTKRPGKAARYSAKYCWPVRGSVDNGHGYVGAPKQLAFHPLMPASCCAGK